MRVFLTGGTGLIGKRLVRQFLGRGDQVTVLTRRYAAARQMLGPDCGLAEGDPTQPGDWADAVGDCDAVIHLAGENVFGRRWNAAFKQLLVDSRVKSTQNVVEALRRRPRRGDGQPKVLVNASAIGYYGPRGDEELGEDAPPGHDFLAELCQQWEAAARAAESSGVRCAIVRVGVVLDKEGGALAKLLPPFKMFAGGPVGSGRQWMSWVHHEDMVGLLLLALDHAEARGPLNGTAPNPVTNRDFSKSLGRALQRPAFLPTPGFALRLGLGEVADVVLTGQRVLPRRALALGYAFRYPTIDAALAQILG
jgi:uncharacterized protein (TIGR01777 family)